MLSCGIKSIQFHFESFQTPAAALLCVADILAGKMAIETHQPHQEMTSSGLFLKVLTVLFRGAVAILTGR